MPHTPLPSRGKGVLDAGDDDEPEYNNKEG